MSLLVLEPIGVTCLLLALLALWPSPALTSLVERSAGRAGVAASIVGIFVVGFVVLTLVHGAFELWRLHAG